MIGQTISHYQIFEKIGKGGMGVVYKAHDINLERIVALKFLPYEFVQDDELIQRFINEAKLASSLQHNNICTVHEIGESDDDSGRSKFICMDYYEGETLKQKLERGIENASEIEGILLQTAEGLRAAHEKGITHRDVKPSNIFVTNDGTVKILDFGLAKGMHATQLTKLGSTAGTVSYMSPEQLTGNNVDNRTDIWSFGVVMFELLCGERPFNGEIDHAIIYSIINEEPDWKLLESAQVDEGIKKIVSKCLEKDLRKRYQSINELLADLNSIAASPTVTKTAPDSRPRKVRKQSFMDHLLNKSLRIAAVLAVIIVIFILYQDYNRQFIESDIRIAILPISYDGDVQKEKNICNGLALHLSGQLKNIGNSAGFRNSGRTLDVVWTDDLKDKGINTSDEASECCNINYAISISLMFYEDIIEAHIALLHADDSFLVDSDELTDSTKNREKLQSKMAVAIAGMLNIEIAEPDSIASGGFTFNDGVFDDYLQAVGFLENYERIENIDNAIYFFHEAVKKDTNYTLAYTGLAEAFYRKYDYEKNVQYADSSTFYAYKALSKNPDLYEAHVSLGNVHRMKGQYEDAILDFNNAIEINKYNEQAYRGLTRLYNEQGKFDLAEKTIKTAIKLNPKSWANYNYLGVTYRLMGKNEKAKVQFKKILELRPYNLKAYNNLAGIYELLGKTDSALYAMSKSLEIQPTIKGYKQLGAIYFIHHKFDEAAEMFLEATKISGEEYILWGNLGEAYYWSGQKDKAYENFSVAIEYAEKLLGLNPKDTYVLANLAGYYSRQGNKEEAEKLLAKALRYGVSDPSAMYTIASTYELLGDRENAISWLSKAIENGHPLKEIESYIGFEDLRKDERYRKLVGSLK